MEVSSTLLQLLETAARPWYTTKCTKAEKVKVLAIKLELGPIFLISDFFYIASKFCKKVLQSVYFQCIGCIETKLTTYSSCSKTFWSLSLELSFLESRFHP